MGGEAAFPFLGRMGDGEAAKSHGGFRLRSFAPSPELFFTDTVPCIPGIHKQQAHVPLPYSPLLGLSEGRAYPPCCFFIFLNHNSNLGIFLPPPAPPKLSVSSTHSTWTSLPCPSNLCENPPPPTRDQLLCFLPGAAFSLAPTND